VTAANPGTGQTRPGGRRVFGLDEPNPRGMGRRRKPTTAGDDGASKGTKPMEGTSILAWQRAGMATDSSVEQDPGVGRWNPHPRGEAPTAAREAACGGSLARSAASAPPRKREHEAWAARKGSPRLGSRPRSVLRNRWVEGPCRLHLGAPVHPQGGRPRLRARSEVLRPGSSKDGLDPGSMVGERCRESGGERRHPDRIARSDRADTRSELPSRPVERGSVSPRRPAGQPVGAHAEIVDPDGAVTRWQRRSRSEPHLGGGRTARGEQTSAMGHGCRRGEPSKGTALVGTTDSAETSPEATPRPSRNPANPRSGTGLQHARNPRVEEPVAVVRNHEGGT
jgi:hypothetical protein